MYRQGKYELSVTAHIPAITAGIPPSRNLYPISYLKVIASSDGIWYSDLLCPFKVIICDQLVEGVQYIKRKQLRDVFDCGNKSRKMK